jgi:DinB superfamily
MWAEENYRRLRMKYAFVSMLLAASIATVAQTASAPETSTKDPVTSAVKEILPRQQRNLVAAVEEMPADKFSYKPTDQQITFGHLVFHIIQSNDHLCSKIGDIPEVKPAVPLTETDGKDKLLEALKSSFDFCTNALGKVDDSKLSDELELFGGRKGSRALALIALTNDWADHYSAAAMYLRLNGLLPPSAQPKK